MKKKIKQLTVFEKSFQKLFDASVEQCIMPVDTDHNMTKDYILYILVRNDLPSLNPGKAMAQAVHAGHLFSAKYHEDKAYKEWAGDRGFGTTVTLSADFHDINRLIGGQPSGGWVMDPTYPITVPRDTMEFVNSEKLSAPAHYTKDGKSVVLCRKEDTCAYLFGERSQFPAWLFELPMYQ